MQFLKKLFRFLEKKEVCEAPEKTVEVVAWEVPSVEVPSAVVTGAIESLDKENTDGSISDVSLITDEKEVSTFKDLLQQEKFSGINSDLYLFIQDRIEQLQETEEYDMQWIIDAVDLIDELRMMEGSFSEKDKEAVEFINSLVLEKITSHGTTLIDRDEWTPSEQRAISVTRDSNVCKEKILRKGATGLIIEGRLIRKQEVILLIPEK